MNNIPDILDEEDELTEFHVDPADQLEDLDINVESVNTK